MDEGDDDEEYDEYEDGGYIFDEPSEEEDNNA